MNVTGAQAIAISLIAEAVDTVFGYPGGAIMPTYDALLEYENDINHILVRHEQAAVHSAAGYSRSLKKTGVVIATSGPGATNLITGIADALIDSTPIVCITGQVFSGLLGTDAFQEADIIGMTVASTKWNYQITEASEIPFIIKKAFEISQSGRPGPVLLDITKDAQTNCFNYVAQTSNFNARWNKKFLMDMNIINAAALIINKAKRPLILLGQGVVISGAESELLQLAEKGDIPVACTLLGLSGFPSNHDLYKGMLGMHGNYSANILSNKADVVIAIGMRFDDRVTGDLDDYLPEAQIIHIDIDDAELNKNVKVDIGILADAKEALIALLPFIKDSSHVKWNSQFDHYYLEEKKAVILPETKPDSGQIKMAEVVNHLSNTITSEFVIVTDVGQHQMISARYCKFKKSDIWITSGGLGTMGFALPAAIGAKIGLKNTKEVIAIIGDGGIQMTIQELALLRQEEINLKIIILNNSHLGMVRQWQELFFNKRYSYTNISSPNFEKISDAYGIKSRSISNRKNLYSAIDDLLNAKEPFLLEVNVEQQENVFPMVPTGASISKTKLSIGDLYVK
jgi:acetolactate synthase I/II/III large subunit